jgi:hypothetical protein
MDNLGGCLTTFICGTFTGSIVVYSITGWDLYLVISTKPQNIHPSTLSALDWACDKHFETSTHSPHSLDELPKATTFIPSSKSVAQA